MSYSISTFFCTFWREGSLSATPLVSCRSTHLSNIDCIERDIYNYQGGATWNSGMRDTVSNVLNDVTKKTLKLLVEDLKRCGGKGHLIMFLSGKGGSGKSYTVFAIEKSCCYFCQYVSMPFEKNTILLTAMTGCAAALIKGVT